jgi:hypothetical protein
MKRFSFTSVVVVCALALSSCIHDGPVKILLASSQSESGQVRMSLEETGAPVDTVPNTVTFDVRGQLPDLGDRLLAWSIGRRRKPAGELTKIAFALNIQGLVEKVDDNSYVVKDSTGKPHFAHLFVDEAGGWWTYSSGIEQSSAPSAGMCATADPSCQWHIESKTPLLSAGEAIRRTNQILARADMVPTNYPLTAEQVGNSTVVTGLLTLGGIKTNLATQFIYGANGELMSASGPMIAIAMAGRFPILTPTEAVKRLNNPIYATIGSVTRLAATSSTSTSSSDGSSSSTTVVPITGVRFTLMETKLANLTHMLLPAYTYFNIDGEVGTVLAITNDHLVVPRDATVTTETVPVSGGVAPPTPSQPLDDNTSQQLLGLPEAEATKVAMANGWVVRIAARDGEFFMLTQDYSKNRVNLSVKHGTVIAITVG